MTTIAVADAAHRNWILLAVCIAAITMPLNFTAAAVALPAIGRAYGAEPLALSWVTNAFMLSFGSCLMLGGALADVYGRKRIFLTGISAFALLSAALTAAPSLLWFDLLRAAQGIAAAAALSGGMSALAQEFEGHKRMRAFSFVGSSFGIGLAFGPIASGMMIEAFGWPTIFLMITLLASFSTLAGLRYMRESRSPQVRAIDWPGALSFTWALTVFTYAMLQGPQSGWSDAWVVTLLACALLSFMAFVVIERRVAQPMLDLTLFRYPRFVGVQLLAAAPAYAFVVLLVLLPIRFVGIEGMSEVDAGRLMIALSAPLLILPIIAGALTRWLSSSILCGIGLLVSACGLWWLSHALATGTRDGLAPPMLVIGVGISLPWGLMDGLAVSVVPKERAGMATGIFSTMRVAGEGVAVAVVTAILSALTSQHLAEAAPQAAAHTSNAAQHMVTGDLRGAVSILPDAGRALLVTGYSDAFDTLLIILATITLATAAVVFLFLDRGTPADDDVSPAQRPVQA